MKALDVVHNEDGTASIFVSKHPNMIAKRELLATIQIGETIGAANAREFLLELIGAMETKGLVCFLGARPAK